MPVQKNKANLTRKGGTVIHLFQSIVTPKMVDEIDLVAFAEKRSISSIVAESLEMFLEKTKISEADKERFKQYKKIQEDAKKLRDSS